MISARKKEIKRDITFPYNSQQKGFTERKNRIIMEATKAMIHDQSLSMFMWVEASRIVVYVQNKCPRRFLKNMTLEEAFMGVVIRNSQSVWTLLVPIQSKSQIQSKKT